MVTQSFQHLQKYVLALQITNTCMIVTGHQQPNYWIDNGIRPKWLAGQLKGKASVLGDFNFKQQVTGNYSNMVAKLVDCIVKFGRPCENKVEMGDWVTICLQLCESCFFNPSIQPAS